MATNAGLEPFLLLRRGAAGGRFGQPATAWRAPRPPLLSAPRLLQGFLH